MDYVQKQRFIESSEYQVIPEKAKMLFGKQHLTIIISFWNFHLGEPELLSTAAFIVHKHLDYLISKYQSIHHRLPSCLRIPSSIAIILNSLNTSIYDKSNKYYRSCKIKYYHDHILKLRKIIVAE